MKLKNIIVAAFALFSFSAQAGVFKIFNKNTAGCMSFNMINKEEPEYKYTKVVCGGNSESILVHHGKYDIFATEVPSDSTFAYGDFEYVLNPIELGDGSSICVGVYYPTQFKLLFHKVGKSIN